MDFPIPVSINGINDANKIRVVLYQSNSLCHAPLTAITNDIDKQLSELKGLVSDLQARIEKLEKV